MATSVPLGIYKPANGEVGWGTLLRNSLETLDDRITDVGTNVKGASFGAVGDGSTDDTAAFHAARDATPEGGTIIVPLAHYKVSSLDWTRSVTVKGSGWWNNTNDPFGDAHWGSGNYGTWYGGTVIRCTNTTTRGMLAATGGKLVNIQDLMLLGPGTGTSNGIEVGTASNAYFGVLRNLLVANFGGAAYRGRFWISTQAYNLQSRGCTTGISMSDTSNNVSIYGAEVQHSTVYAIVIATNCTNNNVYGGLVQNATGTGVSLSGEAHHVDGVYFENPGVTLAVNFPYTGGGDSSLTNCYMSTADEDINVQQPFTRIGPLRHGAGGYNVLLDAATGIIAQNLSGANVTDTAATTITSGVDAAGSSAAGRFIAKGGIDTRVVATASLPAAATAMNGHILIEDGGAGDRNLIIYAGGQRFRIDGGANV